MLDATKLGCPLLMLAGHDDQLWPSVPMARMLAAQRSAAGVAGADQLITYDGAGHLIRLGLLPTDSPWTNGIAFGGTREGLAHAQSDATGRVDGNRVELCFTHHANGSCRLGALGELKGGSLRLLVDGEGRKQVTLVAHRAGEASGAKTGSRKGR